MHLLWHIGPVPKYPTLQEQFTSSLPLELTLHKALSLQLLLSEGTSLPQTPIAVYYVLLYYNTKYQSDIFLYKPSSSMISIEMIDAVELFVGLMISNLPPNSSKPSATSSFITGTLITVVSLPLIVICLDICL